MALSLPRFVPVPGVVIVGLVLIETALPVDLRLTLRYASRGSCVHADTTGVWRATRTPDGPTTTHLRSVAPDRVEVRAFGPGAEWALSTASTLIGAADDDGGLLEPGTGDGAPLATAAAHATIRRLARRFRSLRIGATANPFEALVPTILEQKVQGASASASYRAMVRAHRAPAPSAPGGPRLWLPPTPEWLLEQPSWVWHRWGVEARRATTIRAAASYAHRVTETISMDRNAACARLGALPGVGPWSVAEVSAVAFGDTDAVSVGDFWLCHWVTHNLAGEPRGNDERMLELLAPWPGQRGRVCRLLMIGGDAPPRFGPRLAFEPIARI